MSTFNGVLAEFPDIQIDYFRKSDDRPPPLACFLTHVHTDHLQGLESFRAPFIYCSPTTRELLLRLERFPHRLNYELGIFETRVVTYKHLKKLVRAIPLNRPTEIELTPRKSIRVTLIDANHCPGSVMFLIEGDGKTILYTGDIRAEKWWVDSLIRNPFLIPYTLGDKRLDNLYLDTTYLHGEGEPPENFSSKAEGIAELLKKVQSYPSDTIFHFRAWTFGYEEVWLALAAALNTKIHADSYQLSLYQSLAQANQCIDTAAYNGYRLGNDIVPGCLTCNPEEARIHLCVPPCEHAKAQDVVHIRPVLARREDGFEIPDMGAGGGSGDVYLQHEIELPDGMKGDVFVQYCEARMIHYTVENKAIVRGRLLTDFANNGNKLFLAKYGILLDDETLSLKELADLLVYEVLFYDGNMAEEDDANLKGYPRRRVIRFPYARHSSYFELCHLITVFKPKDIHACVVDDRDVSSGKALVQEFFGHYLTGHLAYTWGLRARRDLTKEAGKDWEADREALEKRKKSRDPEPGPAFRHGQERTYLYAPMYETFRDMNDTWLLPAILEGDFPWVPSTKHPDLAGDMGELPDAPCSDEIWTKREEVENARKYLQELTDLPEMQIGPLPSTLIGGLDGTCDHKTAKLKRKADEQEADEQEADEHQADEHQAVEQDAVEQEAGRVATEHPADSGGQVYWRNRNETARRSPPRRTRYGSPLILGDIANEMASISPPWGTRYGSPPILGDIEANPPIWEVDSPPTLGETAVLRLNADRFAWIDTVPLTTFNLPQSGPNIEESSNGPSFQYFALPEYQGSFSSGSLTRERLEEQNSFVYQDVTWRPLPREVLLARRREASVAAASDEQAWPDDYPGVVIRNPGEDEGEDEGEGEDEEEL